MTEQLEGGEAEALSAEETAFFESGGETPIAETPESQSPEEVETPEAEKPEQQQAERDEKGRFVPHQALHAEREEHKKTRAELNEIRERQARLDERWNMLSKAQQQEVDKKAEADIPDPDSDPLAAVAWLVRQTREQKEAQTRQQAEYEQQSAQQQQVAQVVDYVDRNYAEAVQTDPTVQEAYTAAFDSYAKELQVLGYRGQAFNEQITTVLRNFQWVAAQQMQQGVPLADFIKSVAQTRGWQPKPVQQQTDPGKMELSEKLGKVATAIEASKTLGQAQGRAGSDALSAQAIADMPAHEFEAWMKVPDNARRFKSLMGG